MKAFVVALAVTYPFLAHYALAADSDAALVASVVVLLAAMLLPGLARGSRVAIVVAFAAVLGLVALVRADLVHLVLFVPPVAITAGLASLFGHSLRGGHTPLIQKLVLAIHPPDSPDLPDVLVYTRRLTAIWATLLGLLAAVNFVLALIARPGGVLDTLGIDARVSVSIETWSLFANFIGYAAIAALFAIEYAIRKRVFPRQPYRNFADFMQRVARVAPAVFRR